MEEIKSKVETEENIKTNNEEKKKSHPLLLIQQCMLFDQLDNPRINVHNLTRLYRYDKSKLDIPKFISCFNRAVKHHPCFLTVLHENNKDDYVQIYKPELFKEIKVEKMTEKQFNEEVLPNILTNFQDILCDNLLINFRAIETENYLYQLLDHHHIFFDGYSIKLKFQNILGNDDRLYNNFISLASMCAIAKHTNKTDIMVTWSYHGRNSLKEKYIVGNLFRVYPLRIDFTKIKSIPELISSITKQSKELLKMPYYPHVLDSIDGEIMNNIYQKDLNHVKDFCEIKREKVETPPRKLDEGVFNNQVIDACYDLTEKGLEVDWQYPFSKFKKETMQKFSELFIKSCDVLGKYWSDKNEIDILNLI